MKKALDGLPGVSSVTFEPGLDTFSVRGISTLMEDEVRSAVLGQVVFLRLRAFMGRLTGLGGALMNTVQRTIPRGPVSKA